MSWRGYVWIGLIALCIGFWAGLFVIFAGRIGL